MSYGLPTGSNITYGSPGFPDWVYQLGARFNVRASTYPGHQESDRIEAGYARNPARLNRGIDWAGSVADMQRLADYLFSVRGELEQLIWENPQTGRRLGVAGGQDVTTTPYYAYDGGYNGHRDHVHTRQDHPIPLPGAAPTAPPLVGEKVLPYDRNIVPQETGWWCGPAATQVVLNSRGVVLPERDIANEIEAIENPGRGDDRDGTDNVGLIEQVLDRRLPDARYTSVFLPNDPPTPAQKDALWANIVRSINAGYGVIMNWVAPPGNKPRGVKGSPNPSYSGGTTFHYVACMGYDGAEARALWIADSGFRPFGYWISFDQAATLIPPKGYAYANVGAVVPAPPPPPAPPSGNAADVLARATGITLAKATAILAQVQFALAKANCTTPRRIAAAVAQWLIESDYFNATEEYASGPESEERWKYKGRTWAQLTWLENYRGFSVWCHSLGLVPSPDYFVDRPRELADQKWAALGPAYWWAIKYPRINEYADRGDIDNVSKWVNAPAWVDNPNKHANHEKERRDAYNRAIALGDQLLTLITATPTTPGDDMAQVPQAQWDAFYAAYMGDLPSVSPLRRLGEGNVGPLHKFIRYMDANTHVPVMKLLAGLGHPDTLKDLQALAAADLSKYPDRAAGKELSNAILASVTADPQAVVQQAAQELGVPPTVVNNAAPQIVYMPAPEPVSVTAPSSTGQVIGAAFDALEALQLSGALTDTEKAPLLALIGVLNTKTGVSA